MDAVLMLKDKGRPKLKAFYISHSASPVVLDIFKAPGTEKLTRKSIRTDG